MRPKDCSPCAKITKRAPDRVVPGANVSLQMKSPRIPGASHYIIITSPHTGIFLNNCSKIIRYILWDNCFKE